MSEILCPLAEAGEKYTSEVAVILGNDIITYEEYNMLVAMAVSLFQKKGVSAGERIAIIGGSCRIQLFLLMALLRLKAVACPISPHLPEGATVSYTHLTLPTNREV